MLMRVILELNDAVRQPLTLHDLPDVLREIIGQVVPLDWVGFYLVTDHATEVCVLTNSGLPFDWDHLYQAIGVEDALAFSVLNSSPGQLIEQSMNSEPFDDQLQHIQSYVRRHTSTEYIIAMPLVLSPAYAAVLSLYRCDRRHPFTPEDTWRLSCLAPAIIALARVLLAEEKCNFWRRQTSLFLGGANAHALVLNRHLGIVEMPPETEAFLKKIPSPDGHPLPFELRHWLQRVVAPRGQVMPDGGPWNMHLSSGLQRMNVTARVISEATIGPLLMLYLEEESREDDFSLLARKGLTPREIECLGYLRLGCSNRQIGELLGIESGTVKKHLHNIGDKLHAYGRAEIIYQAMQSIKELSSTFQGVA